MLMFFLDLDAAKKEIDALKTSVNTLEREKRDHVQSEYIYLQLWYDFNSG